MHPIDPGTRPLMGSATGRDFIFFSMDYTKQTLTLAQQIETLKQRGLIIDDEAEATAILDRTSYFRLADYWRPMEVNRQTHVFKTNTHFNDIVTIYRFDTKLKQLIFNAILQIEITTRSKMIRYFSADHDPFWFANKDLSEDAECFQSNIAHVRREIKRSQEDFISAPTMLVSGTAVFPSCLNCHERLLYPGLPTRTFIPSNFIPNSAA